MFFLTGSGFRFIIFNLVFTFLLNNISEGVFPICVWEYYVMKKNLDNNVLNEVLLFI